MATKKPKAPKGDVFDAFTSGFGSMFVKSLTDEEALELARKDRDLHILKDRLGEVSADTKKLNDDYNNEIKKINDDYAQKKRQIDPNWDSIVFRKSRSSINTNVKKNPEQETYGDRIDDLEVERLGKITEAKAKFMDRGAKVEGQLLANVEHLAESTQNMLKTAAKTLFVFGEETAKNVVDSAFLTIGWPISAPVKLVNTALLLPHRIFKGISKGLDNADHYIEKSVADKNVVIKGLAWIPRLLCKGGKLGADIGKISFGAAARLIDFDRWLKEHPKITAFAVGTIGTLAFVGLSIGTLGIGPAAIGVGVGCAALFGMGGALKAAKTTAKEGMNYELNPKEEIQLRNYLDENSSTYKTKEDLLNGKKLSDTEDEVVAVAPKVESTAEVKKEEIKAAPSADKSIEPKILQRKGSMSFGVQGMSEHKEELSMLKELDLKDDTKQTIKTELVTGSGKIQLTADQEKEVFSLFQKKDDLPKEFNYSPLGQTLFTALSDEHQKTVLDQIKPKADNSNKL